MSPTELKELVQELYSTHAYHRALKAVLIKYLVMMNWEDLANPSCGKNHELVATFPRRDVQCDCEEIKAVELEVPAEVQSPNPIQESGSQPRSSPLCRGRRDRRNPGSPSRHERFDGALE